MNQNFFNPSVPFRPPRAEVNWSLLAQRWANEHAFNEPPNFYPNSGNNYRNPGQNQTQQYGSFFLPPPSINNRPPPIPQSNFLHSGPPPPIHLNQMPPVPLPTYGNPYASNSWTNTAVNNEPPRPLFQSHANEVIKPANQSNYNSNYDAETSIEGAMPHWLNEVNVDDPAVMNWMSMGDWSAYDPDAVIDQQTRKKLPAWILEGLEKAEKEKKQADEKNKLAEQNELKEQQRKQRREKKGLGKFDTDSEDEADDDASSSKKLDSKPALAPKSQIGRKRKRRDIDEQDFKDNQMVAIKRLVTNVLLETSDSVINELCQRVLSKAKSKAKPQLIAKSSGLAALNSIVEYSDDEDSDEE